MLRGAAIGGAGLTVAALLGCGREPLSPAAETPAGKQPKRGGSITHMSGQETRGEDLDPQTDTPLKGESYRLFYQGLLDYHPETYEVLPQLAQKWEQPSQTEYIFTLHPSVRWQNRPPVNARPLAVEDVVFNLNRARSTEPRFTGRSLLATVDRIEAVDRSYATFSPSYGCTAPSMNRSGWTSRPRELYAPVP